MTHQAEPCPDDFYAEADYMTQQNFSGMDEQARKTAADQASQEFQARKMAKAQAAFLSKYKFKADDGSTVTSQATLISAKATTN